MSQSIGWFAEHVEKTDTAGGGWKPSLETGRGLILSFDIWFNTEQECLDWIREDVIGKDLITNS